MGEVMAARRRDWRCGAVVYQVFVDRFARPDEAALAAKRELYASPRRLRAWSDLPESGEKNVAAGLWSHELDFWGGDLVSLRGRLDHIEGLGAEVVYLNPIHPAHTNHKYDASDYFGVSPEYGTVADVEGLAADLHGRGMHLMLDGVFNHMGATSPRFVEAQGDPASPWRAWFEFGEAYAPGYRAWFNIPNLPEVNLESEAVQARVWGDEDSVVRGWLARGVDGWRLDVAYDIGPVLLGELVDAARATRPDAWVVGEVWSYPDRWAPPLDGAMNFHGREILLAMSEGRLSGARAGEMLAAMYADLGMEAALRSWLILDNHDTDRLATWSKNERMRRLLVALHLTLPGAPVVYYGSELGMEGRGDPGCRAPMRWDLVSDDNPTLGWWRRLLEMRAGHEALRLGDFRLIASEKVLAFTRTTERVGDTVVVLANPSSRRVTETLALPLGKVMSGDLVDLLEVEGAGPVHVRAGVMPVTLDAWSVRVLTVSTEAGAGGYTPYGRVH
ncbi:MAG: hypothetical protein KDA21_13020 [Phycisphaerales bacterium]|nr:hypothetical protein [Phycisphaerales bacterium]